jgi:hypothetical protein
MCSFFLIVFIAANVMREIQTLVFVHCINYGYVAKVNLY